MKRFGAGDFPLGRLRAATDKWAENETERRELGRVADIMDRHLAKRLNFGAPITVPRANFAHKKAKPPKAGGKRRRWKKNRAVIANTRRVYQRSIDELRHLAHKRESAALAALEAFDLANPSVKAGN